MHIQCDEAGVAWVDDSNIKVAEIVESFLAYDLTAEELADAFPHLNLAQVHSALAYYYDHKTEMDAELSHRSEAAAEIRRRTENADLAGRLRQAKASWRP